MDLADGPTDGMHKAASKRRKRSAQDDDAPAASDGPADLVRKLLQRREALRLYSTVAPEEQPPETSVWGLCEEYDSDHFDAMDEDFNRNSAYTRAFAAVPATKTKWLEVGCGASATLTKLVLAHGPADADWRAKRAVLVVPQLRALASRDCLSALLAARRTRDKRL
mgnify:CR=1 FL=1